MPGPVVNTLYGPGPVATAAINASLSGNNVIKTGVPGKRIVVIGYKIISSAPVTVAWESSGGTILDGPFSFAANEGESAAVDEGGLFGTLPGEDLVLNLSAAQQIGGRVKYAMVLAGT